MTKPTRQLLAFSAATVLLSAALTACGGGTTEEHYDGWFTYNGVSYHCTSFEAGDPCQQRHDCSKCDKV